MFVAQTEPILKLKPYIVCIEMVGNCRYIHEGREVAKVKAALDSQYEVHDNLIRCHDHGDESNRERYFIVGVRRDLGVHATGYQFPTGDPGARGCARHLAEPDEDVVAEQG